MEKKYLKYLACSLTIVIICIGGLNYITDPLLYYQRSSRPFPTLYSEELRYQIPGLIKNSHDHNAAIIGTSMAGLLHASEVGALLNEKTVKLTANGATLHEQSYILSQYLNYHPDAKIIIWVIDPLQFDLNPETLTLRTYNYPFFLYDDSTLNLKYLINYEVTIHSLQTIINDLLGIGFYMKTKDLDKIHTWPLDTPAGCNQVLKNYTQLSSQEFTVIDPLLTPSAIFNKENAAANIKKLTTLAESKKNVSFYFILPPYSIVRYLFEDENNGLERILAARNFFADRTKGISNIKVYDTQADEDVITNLDHYMDMIHYDKKVSEYIIKQISDKSFDTYESVHANSEKLRSLVGSVDFEEIKECGH